MMSRHEHFPGRRRSQDDAELWRGRVHALARRGFNAVQISEKIGASVDQVKRLSDEPFRRGRWIARVRDVVGDMQPLEAVEYLLDLVDSLLVYAPDPHPWPGVTLAPTEARFLAVLSEGLPVCKKQIMVGVYWHRHEAEWPEPKVVDVMISKLRKRLPDGVTIETIYGYGYRLRLAPGVAPPWSGSLASRVSA